MNFYKKLIPYAKAFAEIGYAGNFNYEAGLFLNNVLIELRNDSAKYMAKVGKHLIERYLFYKTIFDG